jgi:hypothetical protein
MLFISLNQIPLPLLASSPFSHHCQFFPSISIFPSSSLFSQITSYLYSRKIMYWAHFDQCAFGALPARVSCFLPCMLTVFLRKSVNLTLSLKGWQGSYWGYGVSCHISVLSHCCSHPCLLACSFVYSILSLPCTVPADMQKMVVLLSHRCKLAIISGVRYGGIVAIPR